MYSSFLSIVWGHLVSNIYLIYIFYHIYLLCDCSLFSGSSNKANSRRFNVTVVSSGPEGSELPTSPVPQRHTRAQHPFASIPEDYAVENTVSSQVQQQSISSRSASPASSWDFSLEESDSVSKPKTTLTTILLRFGSIVIFSEMNKIAKCLACLNALRTFCGRLLPCIDL